MHRFINFIRYLYFFFVHLYLLINNFGIYCWQIKLIDQLFPNLCIQGASIISLIYPGIYPAVLVNPISNYSSITGFQNSEPKQERRPEKFTLFRHKYEMNDIEQSNLCFQTDTQKKLLMLKMKNDNRITKSNLE
ncbi:Hypothetical_protein [Hexamita inflata]|uniref:Hypothetical_protein n=1 Tax=Hexamita inflata TaxID=28002 RepID=A0AA86QTR8_9EUKA|nr:Hypothetical protein HINF_LOCUS45325 [Hexamita inflata]